MKRFRRISIFFLFLFLVFVFSYFYENVFLNRKILTTYSSDGFFKEIEHDYFNNKFYFTDNYPNILIYDESKKEVITSKIDNKKCVNISEFPLKSFFLTKTQLNTQRVIFEYLDRNQEYYGYVLNPLWEKGHIFYNKKNIYSLNVFPCITDEIDSTIKKVNDIENTQKQELVKDRFYLYSVPGFKDDFKYTESDFIIFSEIHKNTPDKYKNIKIPFKDADKYSFFIGSTNSDQYIFASKDNKIIQLKKKNDKEKFVKTELGFKGNLVQVIFDENDIFLILKEEDGFYLKNIDLKKDFNVYICDNDIDIKRVSNDGKKLALLFDKKGSNIISIYNIEKKDLKKIKTLGNIIPSSFNNIFLKENSLYYDEQIDDITFEFCKINI